MKELDKRIFHFVISDDRLTAEIHLNEEYHNKEVKIDRQFINELLAEHDITYGINESAINTLITSPRASKFPLIIAKGIPAKNGEDGQISYADNFSSDVQKTADWNFREVMRIPSVENGQKLATITPPTKGENGIDVYNNPIQAREGKPYVMRAGKNVQFNDADNSFYATLEGQVAIHRQIIEVQPVFEVYDSLSMETGNLDFVGTIIIHGDVPTGYTVKAEGDIKIYGIVEAATIISGGSIYISEGLAGLQSGTIKAAYNIHVGYINQGIAQAGESIYVENSILHSECEANKDIFCHQGNIIGGSISAGEKIEAKDIGTRLSTKTEVNLGISKTANEQEQKLIAKKEELQVMLKNLETIGKKLATQPTENEQIQLTLRRQRKSYEKTSKQLGEIEAALLRINSTLGDERAAELIVNNFIYSNTIICFGKYKRIIQTNHRNVRIFLSRNEITIHSHD